MGERVLLTSLILIVKQGRFDTSFNGFGFLNLEL